MLILERQATTTMALVANAGGEPSKWEHRGRRNFFLVPLYGSSSGLFARQAWPCRSRSKLASPICAPHCLTVILMTAPEILCPFAVLVAPKPPLSISSLIFFLLLVYRVTTIDKRKLNSGIWNGIEG